MRRLVPLLVLAALLSTPLAGAKLDEGGVRVCGASGCHVTVYDDLRPLHAAIWSGGSVAPARARPYYTLTLTDRQGRPLSYSPELFYVPGARSIRDDYVTIPEWRRAGEALRRAARALRPFPRPRIVAANVAGRPVRDPGSYIRLWLLRAPSRTIADPAGPELRVRDWNEVDIGSLHRYWDRVRRHWVPVNLWSARPSPWTDGSTFVWIGRRRDLLKRDGQIVPVSHELAERVRRGRSLR